MKVRDALTARLPAKDGQKTGVVVGPEMDARIFDGLPHMWRDLRLSEECCIFSGEDPRGCELTAGIVLQAGSFHGLHTGRFGEQRNLRLQIDVLIGDVKSQDAAGARDAACRAPRPGR